MRAVAITVADGTQCPAIQHFDEPTLCPGEALVAVKAFSFNNGEIRGALAAAVGHRPGWFLPASLKTHPTDLAFRLVIESWSSSLMVLGASGSPLTLPCSRPSQAQSVLKPRPSFLSPV